MPLCRLWFVNWVANVLLLRLMWILTVISTCRGSGSVNNVALVALLSRLLLLSLDLAFVPSWMLVLAARCRLVLLAGLLLRSCLLPQHLGWWVRSVVSATCCKLFVLVVLFLVGRMLRLDFGRSNCWLCWFVLVFQLRLPRKGRRRRVQCLGWWTKFVVMGLRCVSVAVRCNSCGLSNSDACHLCVC